MVAAVMMRQSWIDEYPFYKSDSEPPEPTLLGNLMHCVAGAGYASRYYLPCHFDKHIAGG